jgi:hypothetical protein
MESIDTVYEYAGHQAALALWGALAGLGIPLLVALGGVAWRFMRVAEDGLARPLLLHFFGLVLVWWLVSPTRVAAGSVDARAPRFAAWLTAGTDTFTRSAIRRIDKEFLDKPFEWDRIAAMCGRAEIYDPALRTDVRTFLAQCTVPAVAALDGTPSQAAERNPLRADTGLPYARFTVTLRGQTMPCPDARDRLSRRVADYVRRSSIHQRVLLAAYSYDGKLKEDTYVDQVVYNVWHGAPDFSDMRITRLAVGEQYLGDPLQDTLRARTRDGSSTSYITAIGSTAAHIWSALTQNMSGAVEAKATHFTVVTLGPELYGLSTMLLLGLFPLAALWALLPGRWTVLARFAQVFVSVKLWPVGWALLTYFGQRRPSTEALTFGGMEDAGTRSIFATVAMMYLLIPLLSFLIVNLVSSAAAMPFRDAVPAPAGGSPAQAALAVARAAR